MVLFIDRSEVEPHLTVEGGVRAVEDAFRELGEDPSINHPRRLLHTYGLDPITGKRRATRRFPVFAGALPQRGYMGVNSKLGVMEGRGGEGGGARPAPGTADSAYVLYDMRTNTLAAFEVGGHGRFSTLGSLAAGEGMRTDATSAVGIKHLAREGSETLGLIGTGNAAKGHLAAICTVLPHLKNIRVFSRSRENRERFKTEMEALLGRQVTPVESARLAVEQADVVMCCTSSGTPVFDGDWLKPGATVACIVARASTAGERGERYYATEVDDTTVSRAGVLVTNSIEQALQDQQGTFWERSQRELISWDQVHELGELVAGKVPGRTSGEQICIFHNNGGQGVADLAIAIEIYEAAKRLSIGTEVPVA